MITIRPQARPDHGTTIDGNVLLAMTEAVARLAYLHAYNINDRRTARIWTRFASGAGDLARATAEELDRFAEAPPQC